MHVLEHHELTAQTLLLTTCTLKTNSETLTQNTDQNNKTGDIGRVGWTWTEAASCHVPGKYQPPAVAVLCKRNGGHHATLLTPTAHHRP